MIVQNSIKNDSFNEENSENILYNNINIKSGSENTDKLKLSFSNNKNKIDYKKEENFGIPMNIRFYKKK